MITHPVPVRTDTIRSMRVQFTLAAGQFSAVSISSLEIHGIIRGQRRKGGGQVDERVVDATE
jgi:hypothetical protein